MHSIKSPKHKNLCNCHVFGILLSILRHQTEEGIKDTEDDSDDGSLATGRQTHTRRQKNLHNKTFRGRKNVNASVNTNICSKSFVSMKTD